MVKKWFFLIIEILILPSLALADEPAEAQRAKVDAFTLSGYTEVGERSTAEDYEEEDTDDLVDPTSVDVPTTDITSGGTGSSGLTTMISLIPMVTGLLNGQMPDINSILGLMGGGGGALSGVTSAIGGGNLSGLTSILGGP